MRNTLILAGAAAMMTLSASANAQETVIIQQAPVATQSTIVARPGRNLCHAAGSPLRAL